MDPKHHGKRTAQTWSTVLARVQGKLDRRNEEKMRAA